MNLIKDIQDAGFKLHPHSSEDCIKVHFPNEHPGEDQFDRLVYISPGIDSAYVSFKHIIPNSYMGEASDYGQRSTFKAGSLNFLKSFQRLMNLVAKNNLNVKYTCSHDHSKIYDRIFKNAGFRELEREKIPVSDKTIVSRLKRHTG